MVLLLNPSPVKQDTTYTKQVYQHSNQYVEVGTCFKWGGGGVLIKFVLYK